MQILIKYIRLCLIYNLFFAPFGVNIIFAATAVFVVVVSTVMKNCRRLHKQHFNTEKCVLAFEFAAMGLILVRCRISFPPEIILIAMVNNIFGLELVNFC